MPGQVFDSGIICVVDFNPELLLSLEEVINYDILDPLGVKAVFDDLSVVDLCLLAIYHLK